MNQDNDTVEVEIFRAGDYGVKGNYTPATLRQIASDYNANTHEAPATLDHEQVGPAYGWVKSVRASGRSMFATLKDISAELRRLVREKRFKKTSIEIYEKFERTGRPYLKAVSFLGAAAPHIRGMKDPVFMAGLRPIAFASGGEYRSLDSLEFANDDDDEIEQIEREARERMRVFGEDEHTARLNAMHEISRNQRLENTIVADFKERNSPETVQAVKMAAREAGATIEEAIAAFEAHKADDGDPNGAILNMDTKRLAKRKGISFGEALRETARTDPNWRRDGKRWGNQ